MYQKPYPVLPLGLISLLSLLFTGPVSADWKETGSHLKLVDLLDREDGYCIDVAGSGEYVRFDLPLLTHNCKEGLYADEAVTYRDDGTLFFPAFEACVTVMGVNNNSLPYNALMLKRCHVDEPFLKATQFQTFEFTEDKQVQLAGSNLCITAGDVSKVTYSAAHRWRSLYMQECNVAAKALSQWQMVKPTTR